MTGATWDMRPGLSAWQPAMAGGRRGRWWRRALLLTLAGLLVAAAGVLGWMTYEVRQFTAAYEGRILPGAEISGIDVAGMTHEEALAAVQSQVAPELDRTLTLTLDGRTWTTTPRDLGATSNAEEAVAQALAASDGLTFGDYARMRWRGERLSFSTSLTVAQDPAGARAFVEALAADLQVPPVDAAMSYDEEAITFTPEQHGLAVAVDETTRRLVTALNEGGQQVEIAAIDFAPTVTLADFGQVLYLNQSDFLLELYEGGQLVDSWEVATGTGGFPTPTGERVVELKRYLPSWYNPAPDGWGRSMPRSIGPGPYNPLGVRAINWSGGDAIRFHGTADEGSIGTPASHGCVRLTNDDVVDLYERVHVGARIISVR